MPLRSIKKCRCVMGASREFTAGNLCLNTVGEVNMVKITKFDIKVKILNYLVPNNQYKNGFKLVIKGFL
jgi:hypothetical protein